MDYSVFDAKTDKDIRQDVADDPDAGPIFTAAEMVHLLKIGKARIVSPLKGRLIAMFERPERVVGTPPKRESVEPLADVLARYEQRRAEEAAEIVEGDPTDP